MSKPNIFDVLPGGPGGPEPTPSRSAAHTADGGQHEAKAEVEAPGGGSDYADHFAAGGNHNGGATDDEIQGDGVQDEVQDEAQDDEIQDDEIYGDGVQDGTDDAKANPAAPPPPASEPPAKRKFSAAQKALFGGVGFFALVIAMTGLNAMHGSGPTTSRMPSIAQSSRPAAAPGDVEPAVQPGDQAAAAPGLIGETTSSPLPAAAPATAAPAPITIAEVGAWSVKAAEAINALNAGQAASQEDNMRAYLTDAGSVSWLNALDSAGINGALAAGKLLSVSFTADSGPPLVTDLGNGSWVAIVHGTQSFGYSAPPGQPNQVNVGMTLRLTVQADPDHLAPGLGIESVVATPDHPNAASGASITPVTAPAAITPVTAPAAAGLAQCRANLAATTPPAGAPMAPLAQPSISPAQIAALNSEMQRQAAAIESLTKEVQAQGQSNTALTGQVGLVAQALSKITSTQEQGGTPNIDNRSILTQYHLIGVSSSADIVQGPNGKITVRDGQIIAGLGKIGKTTPFMASGPNGDYQSWQLITSTGRVVP